MNFSFLEQLRTLEVCRRSMGRETTKCLSSQCLSSKHYQDGLNIERMNLPTWPKTASLLTRAGRQYKLAGNQFA